ncbi:MAG: hypothetical protein K2V38_26215, partial [Gemmataceae bacterium]|nr:hypothetical protein [Gemmataceae bacterium]
MTFNGVTFRVVVTLDLDPLTGVARASFQSLNAANLLEGRAICPGTLSLGPTNPFADLPPDVTIGFLPAEDGTGRGMGYLTYTIKPRPTLPTGSEIRNVADITFDRGTTIATDQVSVTDPSLGRDPNKRALVTLDAVAPTSTVALLPPVVLVNSFPVVWSGADDLGGSGVAAFTVFVSDNGGPFIPWLSNTTLLTATYTGQVDHTYRFYSVAADYVGNTQPTPAPQATITVRGNHAPTGVTPATATVAENAPVGTVVATLTGVDPDAGDALTLALVDGAGGRLTLVGNQLRVAGPIDYEQTPTLTARVRVTDAAGLFVEQDVTVNVTDVPELLAFAVNAAAAGRPAVGAVQRSFVRYVDVTIDNATRAAALASPTGGRARLIKATLAGASPAQVTLAAGVLSATGNVLTLDFGVAGLGGNRNSNAADGYYTLQLDLDGDGVFETTRSFYRILGDVNGDRKVDDADLALMDNAIANNLYVIDLDVNGDGYVNSTDRLL